MLIKGLMCLWSSWKASALVLLTEKLASIWWLLLAWGRWIAETIGGQQRVRRPGILIGSGVIKWVVLNDYTIGLVHVSSLITRTVESIKCAGWEIILLDHKSTHCLDFLDNFLTWVVNLHFFVALGFLLINTNCLKPGRIL